MPDEKAKCPDCHGWGVTLKDCNECGGSGVGDPYTSANCMECNGSGVVEVPCANPQCKGGYQIED